MKKVQAAWGDFPALDLIGILILFLTLTRVDATIFTPNGLTGFTNAVVTTAGLAMAGATFVGTILYQSASPLMRKIIHEHHATVSHNWLFIIGANLVTCVAASFLVGFADKFPWLIERLSLSALALVLLEGLRAIWWLRQISKVDNAEYAANNRVTVTPAPYLEIN